MGNLLSHVGTTSLRKLYPCVLLLYYSHQALHFWHFCSPNGWEFFPMASKSLQHQLGILQCHSTLTLFTWRQHQIPQVKGSVRPTKLQMPISSHRLSPVLLIHCLWSGGFHDHLFGLDTSLNCLTELRETLRWLVTQGYDEDTHDYSEGRGAEHRVWRQWCRTSVSSPEARCPPWASADSTIQKLIKPHALRIYIEASTHRHDQSLTQSLAPLPFLNEASNHGLYFLMTSPHPGVKQSHSESPQ